MRFGINLTSSAWRLKTDINEVHDVSGAYTLTTFSNISQWGNIFSLFSPQETDFAIKTLGQFCFSCSKVTLGDSKTSKKSF